MSTIEQVRLDYAAFLAFLAYTSTYAIVDVRQVRYHTLRHWVMHDAHAKYATKDVTKYRWVVARLVYSGLLVAVEWTTTFSMWAYWTNPETNTTRHLAVLALYTAALFTAKINILYYDHHVVTLRLNLVRDVVHVATALVIFVMIARQAAVTETPPASDQLWAAAVLWLPQLVYAVFDLFLTSKWLHDVVS